MQCQGSSGAGRLATLQNELCDTWAAFYIVDILLDVHVTIGFVALRERRCAAARVLPAAQ